MADQPPPPPPLSHPLTACPYQIAFPPSLQPQQQQAATRGPQFPGGLASSRPVGLPPNPVPPPMQQQAVCRYPWGVHPPMPMPMSGGSLGAVGPTTPANNPALPLHQLTDPRKNLFHPGMQQQLPIMSYAQYQRPAGQNPPVPTDPCLPLPAGSYPPEFAVGTPRVRVEDFMLDSTKPGKEQEVKENTDAQMFKFASKSFSEGTQKQVKHEEDGHDEPDKKPTPRSE